MFGEIAAGGMATVHLGRLGGPAGFSRTVAIKRLHPQYAKDPDFVSMFLDEARLAARIRHPNVVPTLDVVSADGEIFLVMEYVQGASLSKLLRAASTEGAPPEAWIVATIMSGALHGLHAAHEATGEQGERLDIVHRDVSPQNILVGTDGVARVLDFGVAKAIGRLQTTREGRVKGKFAYMAPEQLYQRGVTRQADVWAAAVCTWEALTGTRLFSGDNEAAIVTSVLHEAIPPPSSVAHHLSAEIDRVVMTGLERDTSKRYGSAREMALELERCVGTAPASEVGAWVDSLAHGELAERAARVAALESASSPTLSSPLLPAAPESAELRSDVSSIAVAPLSLSPPRRPRERAAVVAGAMIAASLVILAVALLLMKDRSPAPASAPSALAQGSAAASLTPSAARSDAPPSIAATDLPIVRPPLAPATPPVAAPRRRNAPAPPRPAAPASGPDCDPPYWIDENGHTRYKPACL
jgi:serine/threonine-protein kinase